MTKRSPEQGNHQGTQERSEEQVHQELREILENQPIISVGLVPDGNRRWEKERFGPLAPVAHKIGHNRGMEVGISIARHFRKELPPMNLMPWGFSTDNWNRPQDELDDLFPLLDKTVGLMLKEAREAGGRIIHMGRKEPLYDQNGNVIIPGLPEPLKTSLALAEEETKENKGAILAPAINYSGRDELTRIEERFQNAIKNGNLPENTPFISDVWFKFADDGGALGELTSFIRTAGEHRTSAFGWRADYAEHRVIEKYLPDVTTMDIEEMILDSLKAERRLGK